MLFSNSISMMIHIVKVVYNIVVDTLLCLGGWNGEVHKIHNSRFSGFNSRF
jgi:hypothetical protein